MNISQVLRRAWKIAKTLMHHFHGLYTSPAQLNIDHGHHQSLHMIGLPRQIIEWPGSPTLLANSTVSEEKTMRTGCRRKVSKSLIDDIVDMAILWYITLTFMLLYLHNTRLR